ncbi:MAG TPA: hypothetical protein VM260_11980 [Pirellula sp.]|nr:hypothetical protein [Pirellula sp.]
MMFFWNSKLKAENQRLRDSFDDLTSDLMAVLTAFIFSKPGLKSNRQLQNEVTKAESTIIQIKAIVEQSRNGVKE